MARLIRYEKRGSLFGMSDQSLNEIEDLIQWAEVYVPKKIPLMMNRLVMYMALYNQGEARKMSFGPFDPQQQRPDLAWRTPAEGIRRISQRYYLSWKVDELNRGTWRVYNDSREAYFIEFGISEVGWGAGRHVPKRRIRRPVMKLSKLRTIEWAMRSGAYHRIWVDIYKKPYPGKGFTQIIQSPAMGSFTGPMLGRRLPG